MILPLWKTLQDKTTLNFLETGIAETNCVRELNMGHQTTR
jgi:hypothetical protein